MNRVSGLNVQIFADGADKVGMIEMYEKSYIKGLTTNPTLMKKVGITDYRAFCKDILETVDDKPLSFEVFSDDFDEMETQAHEIASWGPNVNVKIPVTNTKGEFAGDLIRRLSNSGVAVNVTAIMTLDQVERVVDCLNEDTSAIVSVFAGRIADTGRDPIYIMKQSVNALSRKPLAELIWASPRELLNIFHAESTGCHIITITGDVLNKLNIIGKNLDEYSLDTVKMFYTDASSAGYSIKTSV